MTPESEDIITRLISMEAKLDAHLHRTQVSETRLDDHEGRIRILEQGKAGLLAIAGVVSIAVTTFGTYLIGVFK